MNRIIILLLSLALTVDKVNADADGGTPLWTNRYHGPGSGVDGALAVAVDASGNVFVTGYSVGSGGVDDYATVVYTGAGLSLWTNRYNSPGNGNSVAKAIAVDQSGNVFVTGDSWSGVGATLDLVTVAYSDKGAPLWTNYYNGPANSNDVAQAMTVDRNGNVIVTGYSWSGVSAGYNYVTIKYSRAGALLWVNRYNGPGNENDYATAVAVDGSGNVFATGTAEVSVFAGGPTDYATVAYSAAGVPLWTNRYNGRGNGYDKATAIAVNGSGDVFVTGSSSGESNFYDCTTIKYSGAGVPLWTNRYNHAEGKAVAVDSRGNVFVTGYASAGNGFSDYATVAYSGVGVPWWTNLYEGPGNGTDVAHAVAVDSSGNVVVTGYSLGSGGDYDYATLAYSSAGSALWTNRYSGPGNTNDMAYAMALDSTGNVFVTGYSLGSSNSYDYATIKYSSSVPRVRLDLQRLSSQVVLSWLSAGFSLQSAPTITGAFTNIPGAMSPYTNLISGGQQFFRLISN